MLIFGHFRVLDLKNILKQELEEMGEGPENQELVVAILLLKFP